MAEKNDKTADSGAPPTEKEASHASEPSRESAGFPIIGIGASAGGLEALEAFFDEMPSDSGIAFVIVTHQAPPA